METTLQRLIDKDEIHELTARFNRAADGTDPAAIRELFVEDGVMEMRGAFDGIRLFQGAELEQLVAPAADQRVHLTTNPVIDVHGDRATQLCTLLLLTRSRNRDVAAVFTGTYADDLIRTELGWRFERRVVEVDFANEARLQLANAGGNA